MIKTKPKALGSGTKPPAITKTKFDDVVLDSLDSEEDEIECAVTSPRPVKKKKPKKPVRMYFK